MPKEIGLLPVTPIKFFRETSCVSLWMHFPSCTFPAIVRSSCAFLHPSYVRIFWRFIDICCRATIWVFGWVFGAFIQPAFLFTVAVSEREHRGVVVIDARIVLPKTV